MSNLQNQSMTATSDCMIKVANNKRKGWSDWIPGKTLGTEVVDYPTMPNTPIFLIEYLPEKCTSPQRGWFNPALGAIWWRGKPEPTLSYRESSLLLRSLTQMRVAIDPQTTETGQQGLWHKAVFKPAGLGESTLVKGFQIEEGRHKGQFFTGHTYFRITAVMPRNGHPCDVYSRDGGHAMDRPSLFAFSPFELFQR